MQVDPNDPHRTPSGVKNGEKRRTTPVAKAAREYYSQLARELGVQEATDSPSWSDVHDLERRILAESGSKELTRHAWIIRNRYREVAGEPKYALYTASSPPGLGANKEDTQVDAEALRADLLILHHQIVRELIFADAMEQQRALLSQRMAWITLGVLFCLFLLLMSSALPAWAQLPIIVVLLLTVLAWIIWGGRAIRLGRTAGVVILLCSLMLGSRTEAQTSQKPAKSTAAVSEATKVQNPMNEGGPIQPLTTLVMAAIAGFLGGTLSVVRRIQSPTGDGDAIRNLQKLTAAESYIVLAPISGVIAALVLYAFFCGGLLKGSLFPTIICEPLPSPSSPVRFLDFLNHSGPKECEDQGKVLVWCFIAGFAERLVPDAIDRLTQSSQEK